MRDRVMATAVVGLFAVPPLVDLAVNGWTQVFHYFAADSYLYFAVGRNFAEQGIYTIDLAHPTNGFHPLWQLLVGLFYEAREALSLGEPVVLTALFLTSVGLISTGIWAICRAVVTARGSLPFSYLLLPLGVYGLVALPFDTAFGPRGHLWGFINGLESGLSIFFYGLLVLGMVRIGVPRKPGAALYIGTLLAALLVARLDNVFLGVAVCAAFAVPALLHRDWALLRTAVLVGTPVLVMLAAYLSFNLVSVGIAWPVSGLSKFGGLDLQNLRELVLVLSDPFGHEGKTWRIAQIVLPMAVAIVALLSRAGAWRRPDMDSLDRVFVATSLFVLMLGLYNLLLVPLFAQGHWYFPISILFVSLFLLDALQRSRRFAWSQPVWAAPVIASGVLLAFAYSYWIVRPFGPVGYEKFVLETAPLAKRHYGEEVPRILSFDDGIIAYATGWPVMTGFGFMLDAEAIETLRSDRSPDRGLLALAYERGFDRISSLFYFNARHLRYESPSDDIRREITSQLGIPRQIASKLYIPDREFDQFEYRVDYLSPDRRFGVIRMRPRQ
jgi:hypothetical protein